MAGGECIGIDWEDKGTKGIKSYFGMAREC
jgi:hypothetical protein